MSRGFPRVTRWPSWPYIGEVARSLLGMLLAVVLALEWGTPGAAVAAGGCAAIAGATALQDGPRSRVPSVLGVTAVTGFAVLLGSLSAPHGVLFVVVIALSSAAAGLAWAAGADIGLVAAAITALLVTCSHQSTTAGGALVTTLLTVLGGLIQVVLVAMWPRQRWQTQRLALASAYASMAADARELAVDASATLDVSPLFNLRDAFIVTERPAVHHPPAYTALRGRCGLPERIGMTLTAMQSNSDSQATHDVMIATADVLDAIGDGGRGARSRADRALAALDEAAGQLPPAAALPVQRLQSQLREATELQLPGPTVTAAKIGEALESVRAQMSWNSPILRHAVRLAGTVTVGAAVAAVTGLEQGYWIVLTVLLVLRPETAHTYTRCVVRVLGYTMGIALATSITVLLHPAGPAAAASAVLLVGVAYAVSSIGYAPLTAGLAAAIVFLVEIGSPVHGDTVGQRLVATAIGGALAIAGHVVLPDRSTVRMHQRAGELLKAEIDYAATVIRTFVHPVADTEATISAAWDRAERARAAFEAASGSARADVPSVRRWLTTYRAGLNAVTGSCAALERQVPTAYPDTLDRRFVVAVDDYVDALRGEAPRAGRAWTLDATHLSATEQQLRESAGYLEKSHVAQRVLVGEVETITRHLLTIAEAES